MIKKSTRRVQTAVEARGALLMSKLMMANVHVVLPECTANKILAHIFVVGLVASGELSYRFDTVSPSGV